MKVTLDVCDQCGAVVGSTESHKLIHSFSPKFYKQDFKIKVEAKPLNKTTAKKRIKTTDKVREEHDKRNPV